MLLESFDKEKLRKILLISPEVKLNTINDLLFIHGEENTNEVLTSGRFYYIEKKFTFHLRLYKKAEDPRQTLEVVKKSLKEKFSEVYHLKLHEELPKTKNGGIENFSLINATDLLPKTFICSVTKNCKYSTKDPANFKRHEKICAAFNTKEIKTRQISYGDDRNDMREMVEAGIIPNIALDYRNFSLATFDLESLEVPFSNCEKNNGLEKEAQLILLSVAVGTNLGDKVSKCWVRKTLEPSEERKLVKKFLRYLENLYELKQKTLPIWITDGFEEIEKRKEKIKLEVKKGAKKFQALCRLSRFRRQLLQLTRLGTNI